MRLNMTTLLLAALLLVPALASPATLAGVTLEDKISVNGQNRFFVGELTLSSMVGVSSFGWGASTASADADDYGFRFWRRPASR